MNEYRVITFYPNNTAVCHHDSRNFSEALRVWFQTPGALITRRRKQDKFHQPLNLGVSKCS